MAVVDPCAPRVEPVQTPCAKWLEDTIRRIRSKQIPITFQFENGEKSTIDTFCADIIIKAFDYQPMMRSGRSWEDRILMWNDACQSPKSFNMLFRKCVKDINATYDQKEEVEPEAKSQRDVLASVNDAVKGVVNEGRGLGYGKTVMDKVQNRNANKVDSMLSHSDKVLKRIEIINDLKKKNGKRMGKDAKIKLNKQIAAMTHKENFAFDIEEGGRGLGHGKDDITKAVIRGGNRKDSDDKKFDKNNIRFQKYMAIMKKNGIKFDDAKWDKVMAAMKKLNMEELDEMLGGHGRNTPIGVKRENEKWKVWGVLKFAQDLRSASLIKKDMTERDARKLAKKMNGGNVEGDYGAMAYHDYISLIRKKAVKEAPSKMAMGIASRNIQGMTDDNIDKALKSIKDTMKKFQGMQKYMGQADAKALMKIAKSKSVNLHDKAEELLKLYNKIYARKKYVDIIKYGKDS